jgi:hypothetical protein
MTFSILIFLNKRKSDYHNTTQTRSVRSDYADPDCQNEELPRGSIPGSRIEGIFGYASLAINADHAKQSR